MPALTLRLEPELAKQLDKVCKEKGYKKTGLLLRLLRDFIGREKSKTEKSNRKDNPFSEIVGIVSLGGDAVEDCDAPFE